MPGRNYSFINNQIYHIVNRGVASQLIFLNDDNYLKFLDTILYYQNSKSSLSFSAFQRMSSKDKKLFLMSSDKKQKDLLVEILAFCLMPTHFHILLKQRKSKGIPIFIGNFANSYSRYFNICNNRKGPLFQGRFKAVKIENDEQLIHVSRYIHLNPYSSGIMKNIKEIENYPYSSYNEYLNNKKIKICDKEVVLNYFENLEAYKKFVNDQADYQKNLQIIKTILI